MSSRTTCKLPKFKPEDPVDPRSLSPIKLCVKLLDGGGSVVTAFNAALLTAAMAEEAHRTGKRARPCKAGAAERALLGIPQDAVAGDDGACPSKRMRSSHGGNPK